MYRIPRFWRNFKKGLTLQDLMFKRKAIVEIILEDGTKHYSIEVVRA